MRGRTALLGEALGEQAPCFRAMSHRRYRQPFETSFLIGDAPGADTDDVWDHPSIVSS